MLHLFRVSVVAAVVGAMATAAPTAAFAKGGGASTSPKLVIFNCTTGFPPTFMNTFGGASTPPCDKEQPGNVGWAKVADSDGDNYALRITTAISTDSTASYAGVSVLNTTVTGESLPNVRRLSMDFNTANSSEPSEFVFLTLSNGGFVAAMPQWCDTQDNADWFTSDLRNGDPSTSCQLSVGTPAGSGEFMVRSFSSGYWQYGYGGSDPGYALNAWDWMDWYFGSSAPIVTGVYLWQSNYSQAVTGYVDRLTFDDTVFTSPPGQAKKS